MARKVSDNSPFLQGFWKKMIGLGLYEDCRAENRPKRQRKTPPAAMPIPACGVDHFRVRR